MPKSPAKGSKSSPGTPTGKVTKKKTKERKEKIKQNVLIESEQFNLDNRGRHIGPKLYNQLSPSIKKAIKSQDPLNEEDPLKRAVRNQEKQTKQYIYERRNKMYQKDPSLLEKEMKKALDESKK